MANAPTVQSLDQIMAGLQPGYQEQQGILDQQIANTDVTNAASKSALNAAKTQGFNKINTDASERGVAFGGVPIDEQANYLSTEYLPGVQKADAQTKADKLTLGGQKAVLGTEQRNNALKMQGDQQGSLNSWNLQLMQNEFSARENEKNRAAEAANSAANRAATAAASPKGMSGSELANWGANYVKGKQGTDKKISPSAYYAGFSNFFTQTGLGQDEYQAIMSQYVNTGHSQDYKLF